MRDICQGDSVRVIELEGHAGLPEPVNHELKLRSNCRCNDNIDSGAVSASASHVQTWCLGSATAGTVVASEVKDRSARGGTCRQQQPDGEKRRNQA